MLQKWATSARRLELEENSLNTGKVKSNPWRLVALANSLSEKGLGE
jgi:hypothetical protein